MTIEEIRAGETENVEYKVELPSKSIKYMKSVVAFSNGNGGRIVFGVEDGTWEVVGISRDKLFDTKDAITNAIADSCEPMIFPDIYFQDIGEKTVIVVDIEPGRRKPYYIKALGLKEAEAEARIISAIIRQRSELGLSQRNLAKLCSVPQSSKSSYILTISWNE